ncbi:hypothetical protein Bhyg_15407, partial [Pseudolycoriella hygida]
NWQRKKKQINYGDATTFHKTEIVEVSPLIFGDKEKQLFLGSIFYLAPTNFLSAGVEYDFGRSIGRPRARSQMSEARTPKARDTPNMTDRAHVPYEITFTYCKRNTSKKAVKKTVRCYKSGHYEIMNQQIEGINFQREINNRDLESAFEFFNTTMKRIMGNYIPVKTIKVHSNRPLWWTKELQVLKNRRDKLQTRKEDKEYKESHIPLSKLWHIDYRDSGQQQQPSIETLDEVYLACDLTW